MLNSNQFISLFRPCNSEVSSETTSEGHSSDPIHWSWVTLNGPDAKEFLHRLTTVHVKGLQIGQGKPGCFLNSLGKIRAYFTLWNYQTDGYAFEFDAGHSGKWKTELFNLIDQYTFGEKITLQDATSELNCCWIFLDKVSPAETAIGPLSPGQTIVNADGIRISLQSKNSSVAPLDHHWVTVWGKAGQLEQWLDRSFPGARSLTFEEVEQWRIQALEPRIDKEITDSVMPLEVGLQDTISPNKGCYPGQEVIEKIIARGSPPRRLVQIEGAGYLPGAGESIFNLGDSPAEIGQVTSMSGSPQKFIALGLVRKTHAKKGLQIRFQENSENKSTSGTIVKVASGNDSENNAQ